MLQPSLPELLSFSDIKSATDNFSTHLIIGKGSFGNVYRATIATGPGIGNTTTVAVKRRNSDSKQGADEFWTEINLLSGLRHSHLISLIGYCVDHAANEMILVYEYMANGTLADHIYKNIATSSLLSWKQRLEICIGVGRGLEYLHTGTGIKQVVIHRDLKSSNILLDADWEAKISDFGLCKTCCGTKPYTPITASVKGTYAYMDPNYRTTRQLSTKTDVYAFGVLLLEVLCGRRSLDFEVADRQKRLVLWAQQCFSDREEYSIVDPALWGKITDDGLRIFIDIALKCLQDSPKKRPTMVHVVAKLQSAWDSQFTIYSSSCSSGDDKYVRITFGNVIRSSTSANLEIDPPRRWFDTGSGKSDTIKQDPGSDLNTRTSVRRHINFKSSSINIASDVPSNGNQVNADVSMLNTIAVTSETSNSLSHDKDDECGKLLRRMNPPRVAVDNESCEIATVIEVNSTSKQGLLLVVVQVLTDFHLLVTKASRTSDGLWFMDVFIVTDQEGSKVTDKAKIQNLQEVLCVSTAPMGGNYKRSISDNHTTIEFIGDDRPGLLSEVSAIFSNLQCNVVSAELWTQNSRIAAVMCVSDEETKSTIIEPEKLSRIKKLLLIVLKQFKDNREASIMFSHGCARFDRRLHEMMFADRDYKRELILNDKQRPKVDVVNSYTDAFSVVTIRCKNRPNVLFATICTLKNLMYYVCHGKVDAEGPEAYMEFRIKHINGAPIKLNAERQRVIQHIEAAIERGVYEGLKIEIRSTDRVGLLSDVTRIISEHSLTITRSEITTIGDKAGFAFYLDDSPGYPIDPKIIDHLKKEIGQKILQVKGKHEVSYHVPQESVATPTFKDVLKAFIRCVRLYIHEFLTKTGSHKKYLPKWCGFKNIY